MGSNYHPWRELRALTHIVVHWRELHPSLCGATDGHSRTWLDHRLGQAERRCSLAHELEHVRRGHRGCQPPAVEASVNAAAARRLIPDRHALAHALAWARGDLVVAADELWVDEPTPAARLHPEHLHPAERASSPPGWRSCTHGAEPPRTRLLRAAAGPHPDAGTELDAFTWASRTSLARSWQWLNELMDDSEA